jgi:hypothetical protein
MSHGDMPVLISLDKNADIDECPDYHRVPCMLGYSSGPFFTTLPRLIRGHLDSDVISDCMRYSGLFNNTTMTILVLGDVGSQDNATECFLEYASYVRLFFNTGCIGTERSC